MKNAVDSGRLDGAEVEKKIVTARISALASAESTKEVMSSYKEMVDANKAGLISDKSLAIYELRAIQSYMKLDPDAYIVGNTGKLSTLVVGVTDKNGKDASNIQLTSGKDIVVKFADGTEKKFYINAVYTYGNFDNSKDKGHIYTDGKNWYIQSATIGTWKTLMEY